MWLEAVTVCSDKVRRALHAVCAVHSGLKATQGKRLVHDFLDKCVQERVHPKVIVIEHRSILYQSGRGTKSAFLTNLSFASLSLVYSNEIIHKNRIGAEIPTIIVSIFGDYSRELLGLALRKLDNTIISRSLLGANCEDCKLNISSMVGLLNVYTMMST